MSSCIVPVSSDSHLSILNLPYGIFRPSASSAPRAGVAIGDFVLDLSVIHGDGMTDMDITSLCASLAHHQTFSITLTLHWMCSPLFAARSAITACCIEHFSLSSVCNHICSC
ncbi:hypothetical protein KP509_20G080500 [Ceratopteris richardii]|uniref:Fumarylacetoacetase N-terminal domain-containing protein n=1 Tax=Ceratopteris richardii TaxID=49495 RepID=A0A8T2SGQ0_CERRI|nr:hypothetical protein KP509_20G080500 [Ceratopteris richardii]